MTKPAAYFWCLILLVCIELVVGTVYLDRVPRLFSDEAWDAALGWNLAHNGKLAHPFIDGFGGMNVHFLQNRVVLPVISALMFKFTECTIFTSRLISVLFAVLAVCSLFILMSRWFGNKQAFCICLATIIHPWFFEVSRRARPEIFYTAMGIILLLLLVYYYESGSRITAFFGGVTGGILALTHPNGIIVMFCISVCSLYWLRGKPIVRLLLWGSIGFIITLLPYLVYLAHAIQNPQVNFAVQMQSSSWNESFIIKELSRWKNFFDAPKLLPLGVVMFISFLAALVSSRKEDKLLAGIIALYCLILPFVSVNRTPRYLAAIVPFSAALIVRFIWRAANGDYSRRRWFRTRSAFAVCLLLVYTINSIGQIGYMLFSLRNARFADVVDKITAVIEPGAKVYADPIFWFPRDKLNYGHYLILYKEINLKELFAWAYSQRFEYAVRVSWYVEPPSWAEKSSKGMPDFRKRRVDDQICKKFGTRVGLFYDPYYGNMEVYKIDWTKPYYETTEEIRVIK